MSFDFFQILKAIKNSFPYWDVVYSIAYYGKIIGGFLSFVFLAGIIIVFKRIGDLSRRKTQAVALADSEKALRAEAEYRKNSLKLWEEIMHKIHSDNSSDWLAAVIKADAIFDEILKRMNIPGETMGDRLQALDASKLSSLQAIWEAHKLRNRAAHAPDTTLRRDELLEAIEKYKKGFKELGYLE